MLCCCTPSLGHASNHDERGRAEGRGAEGGRTRRAAAQRAGARRAGARRAGARISHKVVKILLKKSFAFQ